MTRVSSIYPQWGALKTHSSWGFIPDGHLAHRIKEVQNRAREMAQQCRVWLWFLGHTWLLTHLQLQSQGNLISTGTSYRWYAGQYIHRIKWAKEPQGLLFWEEPGWAQALCPAPLIFRCQIFSLSSAVLGAVRKKEAEGHVTGLSEGLSHIWHDYQTVCGCGKCGIQYNWSAMRKKKTKFWQHDEL